MDAPEQESDLEVLMRLRMEYLKALQTEDYGRINTVIVPQFLKVFGRYYDSYARDWKNLSLLRLPRSGGHRPRTAAESTARLGRPGPQG